MASTAPPPSAGDADAPVLAKRADAPAPPVSVLLTPVQKALGSLELAHRLGKPVPVVTLADAESAYEVQSALGRVCGWFDDAMPTHWKSGARLPEGPYTHAPLPPRGVVASGGRLTALDFNSPGVEAEFALRLGRAVDPSTAASLSADRLDELEALIDGLCVSIEIVDSRWTDPAHAPAFSKLADLQSHGAIALGAWQPYQRRDWARQRCTVTIGNQPAAEFTGMLSVLAPTAVLVPWLQHLTRHGETVPAGTIVTTGTWCGLLPTARGDLVTVRFDGFEPVSVTV